MSTAIKDIARARGLMKRRTGRLVGADFSAVTVLRGQVGPKKARKIMALGKAVDRVAEENRDRTHEQQRRDYLESEFVEIT